MAFMLIWNADWLTLSCLLIRCRMSRRAKVKIENTEESRMSWEWEAVQEVIHVGSNLRTSGVSLPRY